jgi:hypothetical protein
MDETAVSFEDAQVQTRDIKGHIHVVMTSTGVVPMRITAWIGV